MAFLLFIWASMLVRGRATGPGRDVAYLRKNAFSVLCLLCNRQVKIRAAGPGEA
ncbi:hypothetical protein D3C85_800870 [compost metagenome]